MLQPWGKDQLSLFHRCADEHQPSEDHAGGWPLPPTNICDCLFSILFFKFVIVCNNHGGQTCLSLTLDLRLPKAFSSRLVLFNMSLSLY